ncbi:MAG: hypothetical protein K0S40_2334 [Actinomycetospora sp.]|nr:hypothetical protein [Actinomycetospora sp.]
MTPRVRVTPLFELVDESATVDPDGAHIGGVGASRQHCDQLAAAGYIGFAFSSARGQDRSPRSLSPRPRT